MTELDLLKMKLNIGGVITTNNIIDMFENLQTTIESQQKQIDELRDRCKELGSALKAYKAVYR